MTRGRHHRATLAPALCAPLVYVCVLHTTFSTELYNTTRVCGPLGALARAGGANARLTVSAAARRVDVGTHGDAPGGAGWDALAQASPIGPASTGRKVTARSELHGRDAEGR